LEVANQPRRTAAAPRLLGGVVGGKLGIIQETGRAQPIEGRIDSGRGVLPLQQATPQIEARVCAARDGA
jgi:hypothetical protein